jgi:hypothetical protein
VATPVHVPLMSESVHEEGGGFGEQETFPPSMVGVHWLSSA